MRDGYFISPLILLSGGRCDVPPDANALNSTKVIGQPAVGEGASICATYEVEWRLGDAVRGLKPAHSTIALAFPGGYLVDVSEASSSLWKFPCLGWLHLAVAHALQCRMLPRLVACFRGPAAGDRCCWWGVAF